MKDKKGLLLKKKQVNYLFEGKISQKLVYTLFNHLL